MTDLKSYYLVLMTSFKSSDIDSSPYKVRYFEKKLIAQAYCDKANRIDSKMFYWVKDLGDK